MKERIERKKARKTTVLIFLTALHEADPGLISKIIDVSSRTVRCSYSQIKKNFKVQEWICGNNKFLDRLM